MACPPAHAAGRMAPAIPMGAVAAACAAWQARPDMQIRLFFGLRRPDGRKITNREWRDFVRDVVTPQFPTGFSVLRGDGQWQDRESGHIGHEPLRVLWIATAPDATVVARIDTIRRTYRQRFAQQSVGLAVTAGCDAF
ncbi:DUF3574 domain-containing protein [Komagataeibacter sp. FNDCR2]|uniref:DUF3574 domain-containing protein n=1 Tax=Komagataeibacter sp. FNDCR2 TaxID=2878682 RepID=UPI001E4F6EB7|nr:DUF3574 domain-containing protein [Komagataeibacter sp. FNDCR2]MCE2574426.1 DUF3574 domain-containing protein [Komagataeibacter sp. FNDCR2]